MDTQPSGERADIDVRTDDIDLREGVSRRATLGLLGLGLGVAASTPAGAASDEKCFDINKGKITGRLTSPVTTAGTITGAGPFNGSTALTIDQLVESAGLTGVPATTLSYVGTFVIETGQGTLTLRDVGVFDSNLSVDGEFTSRGRVIGGTGRWEGASGVVFFYGDTEPDETFTAEANGTVCVPR